MACIGLTGLGYAGAGLAVIVAGTIYAVGKTFFWATMLGVVGERFPKGARSPWERSAASARFPPDCSATPTIGYQQDYYASQKLRQISTPTYERYAAKDKSHLLFFQPITGLDGKKVGNLMDKVDNKQTLTTQQEADAPSVEAARLYGGRMALR